MKHTHIFLLPLFLGIAACSVPNTKKVDNYPFGYGPTGEVETINVAGTQYPVTRRAHVPPPKKATDILDIYEVNYLGERIYCATYLRCRNEVIRRVAANNGSPVISPLSNEPATLAASDESVN